MAMPTRASIDIGFVGANQASSQSLSQGFYSLSSRSNVPYVSLTGSSGFYKIFSWGELVEVPCGQTCTVKNESFHAGDIYINCGHDMDNRPARITVPVPLIAKDIDDQGYLTGEYPCDVRFARAAYFISNGITDLSDGSLFFVIGKRYDGSHNTDNTANAGISSQEQGAGYQESYMISGGQALSPIPLGMGAVYGMQAPAHSLLTTAAAYLYTLGFYPEGENLKNAYYLIEY